MANKIELLPPAPLMPTTSDELNYLTNIKIANANARCDLHKSLLLQNTINNFNKCLQQFIFEMGTKSIVINPTYASEILCIYDCDIDLAIRYIEYQLFKK
jgi:hypothetical protein